MINRYDIEPYVKKASILLVVLLSIIIFWGYFAPLNTLAVASGKVIVSGQNKLIQHLEGGTVEQILVKDGDSVKKDDLLVKLDDTQLQSEYKIMVQNIVELMVKRDRLIAQRDNLNFIQYDKSIENYKLSTLDKIKDLQNSIFTSKKELIQSQVTIIDKKNMALNEQILGIDTSLKNKEQYIVSIDEELSELQSLYDENLTDKLKLRDIQRKKILLDNELSELHIKKSSLKVNITQNEEEILKIKKEFNSKVLDELKETLTKIDNLEKQIVAIYDRLEKTNIISPIDGVVDNLQIFNEGSVINSGQSIMSIVPKANSLIVQANLEVTDIDSVKVGQKVDVVFSAFDTMMTFSIEGEVKYISADRKIDQATNAPYYQVDIEVTKDGYEQMKKEKFFLKVGMPADVMILTGNRTMLSYVIKPFLDMQLRSFNEE